MLIGGPIKLKSLSKATLNIKQKELDKTSSYKYLGVVTDETLTWDNYVKYTAISKKVVIVNRRYWNRKELWVQS